MASPRQPAQADNASLHPTAIGFAEASQIDSSFPATFMGLSVDSSSVLIRYTFAGDANLDGVVNALDFNLLASNFGSGADQSWYQGDFNYDGGVTTLDFTALAQNFNQVLASPAVGLSSVVPEPGLLELSVLVTVGLLRRRRRIR